MVPALDVCATTSFNGGAAFALSVRVTQVTSGRNYEQFVGRFVPFAGGYVSIESMRDISIGIWTDYRDTVIGSDRRVGTGDGSEAVRFLVHCNSMLEDPVSMLLEG